MSDITIAAFIACLASAGAGAVLALAWVEVRTRRVARWTDEAAVSFYGRQLAEPYPERNDLSDDEAQMVIRGVERCGVLPLDDVAFPCALPKGHGGLHRASGWSWASSKEAEGR